MRWAVLVAAAACSGRDPMVLVDAAPPPIAYTHPPDAELCD